MLHQNKINPMDETELAAEQAAVKEVKEEEVRSKIITDFSFDEVDDAERIDKLVAREIDNHKKLSSAIGQKIKQRQEKEALLNDPRLKAETKPPVESKIAPEEIGKVVAQELEKRELDALEYPANLKKEIQRVAQVQNITIKAAERDPYIIFKIDEYEKTVKAEEATISRTNRSSGKKTYSLDAPPDVDMTTDEGRKEWDAWKDAVRKAGN